MCVYINVYEGVSVCIREGSVFIYIVFVILLVVR